MANQAGGREHEVNVLSFEFLEDKMLHLDGSQGETVRALV